MNSSLANTRLGRIWLHVVAIVFRIGRCLRDCCFDLCGIARECWPR